MSTKARGALAKDRQTFYNRCIASLKEFFLGLGVKHGPWNIRLCTMVNGFVITIYFFLISYFNLCRGNMTHT